MEAIAISLPFLVGLVIVALIFGESFGQNGKGFMRLSYAASEAGLRSVNERQQQPFVFYLHPWEIDPGQPRVPVPLKSAYGFCPSHTTHVSVPLSWNPIRRSRPSYVYVATTVPPTAFTAGCVGQEPALLVTD